MKLTHLAAVLAAVSMMAPVAHASKSRLGALEVGGILGATDGSLFIKDERNVFLNPAYVSQFGKNLNLEIGNNGSGTTEPSAEGGFMMGDSDLSYGVQVGRTGFAMGTISTVNSTLQTGGTFSGQTNIIAQDSVELMIGGAGGWGASVHYGSSSDTNRTEVSANEIEQTGDVVTLKGGFMTDQFEVFAHFDVIHEITSDERDAGANDEKIEGNFSWRLGGRFNLDEDSSVGGLVAMNAHDFSTEGTSDVDGERDNTLARIEYFRAMLKEDNAMAYYKLGVNYSATSVDAGSEATTDILAIPLTLGVEAKMEEWLLFRGSVTQNVIIGTNETDDGGSPATAREQSNFDSTTVAAGVGMKWDRLRVDAMLAASLDSTGTGADTAGRIDGNNLLGRVGANYSF